VRDKTAMQDFLADINVPQPASVKNESNHNVVILTTALDS